MPFHDTHSDDGIANTSDDELARLVGQEGMLRYQFSRARTKSAFLETLTAAAAPDFPRMSKQNQFSNARQQQPSCGSYLA